MTHPFQIGDKVVCVDDSPGVIYYPGLRGLKIGTVYVISALEEFNGVPAVDVVGEKHVHQRANGQLWQSFYRASRFTKLETLKARSALERSVS